MNTVATHTKAILREVNFGCTPELAKLFDALRKDSVVGELLGRDEGCVDNVGSTDKLGSAEGDELGELDGFNVGEPDG